MIASLGRDGLVARLSVTRKGSKTFLTANAMGPRRSLRLASFSTLPLRQTVITHLQAQTCSLSTSASRFTQKTVSNVKQDVVSSALPPVKKHKVDLRPAPMKIPKSQVSAGPPPTQPVPPHTAVKTSLDTKSDEASATISSEKTGTVAETTRRDFEVASQHGILAPPPEDASRIYKLFHQAKELFKFYFRGLKLINTNRLRVKEMNERVKAGGPPLSRWETRFIRTYNEDALKLIPFALIIIVIEEIIPLVVMYTPFLLPSTCILPSQKERIDEKKRVKQQGYATSMAAIFEEIFQKGKSEPSSSVQSLLDRPTLTSMNGILRLSTWGPLSLARRRLDKHLSYIREDDALLIREDMGAFLTRAELREALEERGLLTEGFTIKQWQSRLRWWLTHINSAESTTNFDHIHERMMLIARSATGRF